MFIKFEFPKSSECNLLSKHFGQKLEPKWVESPCPGPKLLPTPVHKIHVSRVAHAGWLQSAAVVASRGAAARSGQCTVPPVARGRDSKQWRRLHAQNNSEV